MIVRPEQARDVAAIRALLYAAFENHPHHAPGSPPTEHLIVDGLRAAGALTLSLVAEEDGQVIGHIAFSPVLVSQAACDWYGLGPVAVLPGRQKQGTGACLIKEGIERMRALGATGLVLLGESEYYGRFGFKRIAGLILKDVPPEYFLALPLGGSTPRGSVTYHSSFI